MGYSSWSIKFFDMFSIISLLASSGIQVCTKDARFKLGDPSRVSSSWIIWYADFASAPYEVHTLISSGRESSKK